MVHEPIQATQIILVDQLKREVLLGRRLAEPLIGNIMGFCGRIEPGEKPVDCVVRETYKEAKVIVRRENLLHIGMLRTFRPFGVFNVHLYMATQWQGVPKRTRTMSPVWVALHGPYPNDVPEETQRILRAIALGKRQIRITVNQKLRTKQTVDVTIG